MTVPDAAAAGATYAVDPSREPVFLVYGRSGWIGGLVGDLLKASGATWEYGTARLEDRAGILADIERVSAGVQPTSAVNS